MSGQNLLERQTIRERQDFLPYKASWDNWGKSRVRPTDIGQLITLQACMGATSNEKLHVNFEVVFVQHLGVL